MTSLVSKLLPVKKVSSATCSFSEKRKIQSFAVCRGTPPLYAGEHLPSMRVNSSPENRVIFFFGLPMPNEIGEMKTKRHQPFFLFAVFPHSKLMRTVFMRVILIYMIWFSFMKLDQFPVQKVQ